MEEKSSEGEGITLGAASKGPKTGTKRKSSEEEEKEDPSVVRNTPTTADKCQPVAKRPRVSTKSPGSVGIDTTLRKKSSIAPVMVKEDETVMRVSAR